MLPEFPQEFNDCRWMINMTEDSPIECGMLHMGMPCRNTTTEGVSLAIDGGAYIMVGVCDMCSEGFQRRPRQTPPDEDTDEEYQPNEDDVF